MSESALNVAKLGIRLGSRDDENLIKTITSLVVELFEIKDIQIILGVNEIYDSFSRLCHLNFKHT